jgi:hypothetical protein
MTDGDRDLHQAFQASRAAERAETPPFRRVLEGRPGTRRTRGPVRGLLVAGGAAALVVLMVLLGRPEAPASELELARRVMAWRSPTDFLLPADAPGLLSFVPRMGEAPAGSPLRALDPGGVLGPPILPRSPRS